MEIYYEHKAIPKRLLLYTQIKYCKHEFTLSLSRGVELAARRERVRSAARAQGWLARAFYPSLSYATTHCANCSKIVGVPEIPFK